MTPETPINWQSVEKMLAAGVKKTQIAKKLNISPSNFMHRHRRYLASIENLNPALSPQDLETFKKNKADIFAAKQKMILDTLTLPEVNKVNAYQKVGMVALLADKERAERVGIGQNVNVFAFLVQAAHDLLDGKSLAWEVVEVGQAAVDNAPMGLADLSTGEGGENMTHCK